MDTETHEASGGTTSGRSRPPLDVRIVAWFYYAAGAIGALLGILSCSGATEPEEPYRVLFGAVVLADGLTQGVYTLFTALCYWFIAWGLMRGVKSAWWFAMIYFLYCLAEGALPFWGYPAVVATGIVVYISLIGWLWFRQGLYGVRFAASHTGK
jgi:hypothetical protein